MSVRNSHGAAIALATLCGASVVQADAPSDADSKPVDTILVTASPISHNADDIATIVNTVNRQQILQSGGANLADALANEPGVTGTSFASGASRPVIRGFDANRVRILENGIGSFDVSDVGPDHGVPIDPLSTERIEVVRGAATLRYGSQAIGGVVNAINNRVPEQLPDKPFSAEVSGTYGTNADTRQGSALLDARAGQFAFHADGFDRRADDYDIPDGTMGNSYFKGDGYSLGGSYFFGDSHVGVGGVHYDSKYGIPGEDTFIDMKQTKEMLRSSFAIGAGAFQTLTVEGGYADYEHSEIDPATGLAAATFKDNEWDARAEGVFGEVGPFSGSAIGVQLQNRNFSALGEGADYLQPTTTQTEAVFLFAEAPISEHTRLQTGARVEWVSVEGTPASDVLTSNDYTPISASLGLVIDASSTVRFGVTLSSAARAPAQTELFARGPHDGPATFETGDPTLDVERANSLEGTIRVRLDKVRIEGSLWGAKFNNYIFGELTGRTCDDEGNCVVGDAERAEGAQLHAGRRKLLRRRGQGHLLARTKRRPGSSRRKSWATTSGRRSTTAAATFRAFRRTTSAEDCIGTAASSTPASCSDTPASRTTSRPRKRRRRDSPRSTRISAGGRSKPIRTSNSRWSDAISRIPSSTMRLRSTRTR